MRLFRNKANINVKNYRIPAAARPPRWDFRGAQRPRRARPLRLSCRIIGISGRASSVFLALFPILDALVLPVGCRSLLSHLLMASFFGSERRPLRACDRSPIGAVFSYRAGPKLTAGKRSREDEPGRIRAQYRKRGVFFAGASAGPFGAAASVPFALRSGAAPRGGKKSAAGNGRRSFALTADFKEIGNSPEFKNGRQSEIAPK